ncbi:MAG: DUF3164 family protein [Arsenophonus sp. NC-PG7-MAG3]
MDINKVLALWGLDINNEEFQKVMNVVSDSIKISRGNGTYLRFY